jgi:hypothetical protein
VRVQGRREFHHPAHGKEVIAMIEVDSQTVRACLGSWTRTVRLAILLVAAGIAGYAMTIMDKA